MKPALKIAQITLAFVLGSLAVAPPAFAVEGFDGRDVPIENTTPKELADVGIDERLGKPVDLNLTFRNEKGEVVPLSSFSKSGKPVLLSLAYYSCPGLCNFHLNGLNDAFKKMPTPLGKEFEVVVVSIEPKETPELAQAKHDSYIAAYGRPEGANGWHFLVADPMHPDNPKKLAEQVGFKYHWDAKENQWAHASAAYVLTPDGRLSRYFYGIVFEPKMLRLSLVEASNGTIGTIVDKITLFCYHFDPHASKYTIAAFNVVRAGCGLAVVVLASFLVPFWIRSRKESQGEA